MNSKKILVFEMTGREAHFRQPASNSTAFTFPAPPRTTVIGLLGAITGYDDYVEKFSPDKCGVAVEINSVNKTYLEDLNYVGEKFDVKNIPFEYLYEENGNRISFLIYISHEDETVMEDLENRLKNNLYYHGVPKMGKTECFAILNYIGTFSDFDETNEGNVVIDTIVKLKDIEKLDIERDFEDERIISRILMPQVLTEDRYLKNAEDYIVPMNKKGVYAKKISSPYIKLKIGNEVKNITWM